MKVNHNYKKAIIITAPSGSGKTTITNRLLLEMDILSYSVSATTRKPRNGEMDGVDYYFISSDEFVKKVQDNAFIEWEEVYTDMYYGTLKSEVERIWNMGKAVIFVVDVLGAKRLKEYFKGDALSIFIQPPSLEILEKRLVSRGTESKEAIAKRKDRFVKEMSHMEDFDKIIVNEDLDRACNEASYAIYKYLHDGV